MHAGIVGAAIIGVAAVGGGTWAFHDWYGLADRPCGPADEVDPYENVDALDGTIEIPVQANGGPAHLVACVNDGDGTMRYRWEFILQEGHEKALVAKVPVSMHEVGAQTGGARFWGSAPVFECAHHTAKITIFVDPAGSTGITGGCVNGPVNNATVSSQDIVPAPQPADEEPLRPRAVAAGLVVAVGAGVVTWAAFALRALWAPAFTRLVRPRLLDHETRARVHDAVLADPGVHAQELVRRLDLQESLVRYHLRVLQREGLLTAVRHRVRRHYFRAGHASPEAMRRKAALRNDAVRRVHEYVSGHPGRTVSEVADALGVSHTTISRHATLLADVGLLSRRRDGRSIRLETVAL